MHRISLILAALVLHGGSVFSEEAPIEPVKIEEKVGEKESAAYGMESEAAPAAVEAAPAQPAQTEPAAEAENAGKAEAPKGCVVGMQKVSNAYEVKTEEFQRFQKRSQSKLEFFFKEVDRLGAEISKAESDLKAAEQKKDKKAVKDLKASVKSLKKSLAAARKQVRQQCLMLIDEMSELGKKHVSELEQTYKEAVKYIKTNSEYEGTHAGH